MHQEPGRIELLATIAHELRNPLAAIQCAVRVLGAPNQASSTLAHARAVIDRQVLRIARITDDLLSAAHLATGKLELRTERIDVRKIITAAIETCRPRIDAGSNRLILRLPLAPVEVEADPVWITQALTNLLDNSAKYSEREGTIVVSLESTQSEITLRVADRGMGIAAEFLPRIFDLFVQADEARARSSHGMGLGLSLVKRIVELHRGKVDAFSAGPGLGSTFTIRLPKE